MPLTVEATEIASEQPPIHDGFSGQFGIENEAPANANAKAQNKSLAVFYANGPLQTALGYEEHDDFRSSASTGTTDKAVKLEASSDDRLKGTSATDEPEEAPVAT